MDNKIGDEGMRHLGDALARGAAPALETLYLATIGPRARPRRPASGGRLRAATSATNGTGWRQHPRARRVLQGSLVAHSHPADADELVNARRAGGMNNEVREHNPGKYGADGVVYLLLSNTY